jgi:hypothetical protein
MFVTYYKTNTVKLTYGEFWRMAGGCLPFAIAATLKTLGIALSVPTRLAFLEQVKHLSMEELPQLSRGTQMQQRKECEAAGLAFQFFYMVPPLTQASSAVYLDAGRKTLAQTLVVRPEEAPGSQERIVFACSSFLPNGTVLGTGNAAQQFNNTPGFDTVYMPGKSVLETLQRHQERLAKVSAQELSPDVLDEKVKLLNNRPMEHNIKRGVYVPE